MGFNPFKSIDRALDKGSNALHRAASSVRNEFNDTTRAVRRTASSAVNTVRNEFNDTTRAVRRTTNSVVNTARREWNDTKRLTTKAKNSVVNTAHREWNDTTKALDKGRKAWDKGLDKAKSGGNFLKNHAEDIGHGVLDAAGFIPVVGGVADLANAGWYAAKGDKVNAALSAAAAIPFAGDAFAAGKLGLKAAKGAEKLAETGTVAGRVAANVTDEVAEAVNVGGRNVAPAPSTLHTRGNRPDLAERTINGYVNTNVERAGGEITSLRPSGREINRAGQSGTHNIGDSEAAHFHERYRDVAPDGTVREGIRKKAVKAEERHVRELYKALDEGRTRTKKDR
jgi:hypothetical protein